MRRWAEKEAGLRLLGRPALLGPLCPREHPRVPAGHLAALASLPSSRQPLRSALGAPHPCAVAPAPGSQRCPLPGLPADCRGRWDNFVEETLAETNRRNAVDLVRGSGGVPWCCGHAFPSARHAGMRAGVGGCVPMWLHVPNTVLSFFRPRWPPKASAEPLPCPIRSPSVLSGAPDAEAQCALC